MSYHNDEFDRDLKHKHDQAQQAGHQAGVQALGGLGRMAASHLRSSGPMGGLHMEMFLRYNFGVRYFPPFFSFVHTVLIAGALYFSGYALFFSTASDPKELLWAGSIFVTAVLFAIPWAIHRVSILRRMNDVDGQHSQFPGNARLDDLNTWVQARFHGTKSKPLDWMKTALAWVCADDVRRDFIGETAAGILIAYVVGWPCFDRYVTDFLLLSLVMLQFKRWRKNAQKLERKRMENDARMEMEQR